MSKAARDRRNGKIIFIFTSIFSATWLLGNMINVYQYKAMGAVFELLWLPMLCGLIILPVLAFFIWAREGFISRSFSFFSILISVATMLVTKFLM